MKGTIIFETMSNKVIKENRLLLFFLILEAHICPSNPTLETCKLPHMITDVTPFHFRVRPKGVINPPG